jgi:hypothetical protein
MKRVLVLLSLVALLLFSASGVSKAQAPKWIVGGNMLLVISTGGGFGSNVGFTFGPMAEVVFSRQYAIGTEFNIHTTPNTPIDWVTYFKFYIQSSSKIKPYVDGGLSLLFIRTGPYFGIRFGGGVGFLVAKNIWIGPDLQLGPIFATGSTVFFIMIRGGFRYEIP